LSILLANFAIIWRAFFIKGGFVFCQKAREKTNETGFFCPFIASFLKKQALFVVVLHKTEREASQNFAQKEQIS
jgi:hypothetical protein